MTPSRALAASALLYVASVPAWVQATSAVDILRPVFGLPAHVVNRFVDTSAVFVVAQTGEYVVLDKREHGVYTFDATGRTLRRILEPGPEPGRIIQPTALTIGSDDIFAVADAPSGYDRIQYFSMTGMRVGGFYLPPRIAPRLSVEGLVLDSVSSLAFTGKTFLVNQPEWGALFAEFDADGHVVRQVGLPRPVLQADDREVAIAMNIGIPVIDPTGGFFFVFQTGVPLFRKYDQDGALVFERHIEGPELDARIRTLPTTWATRPPGTRPVVAPLVRAAAADRHGRLWISLAMPYTYVYDAHGDKVRTVGFQAAGTISPSSLFFTSQGRLLVGPGGYEFDVD